jgi:PAS domain S-box-containing protein
MGSRSDEAPIRVLHVDDEPGFAEVVSTFLKRADERFAVETATSASEGLELLASDSFDCVVSDYDMPGQPGIDFLKPVRERDPELPFILFTGKGSEEIASEAISAGVTDYLRKESGTDQYALLATQIRNATERARAERERRQSDRRFQAVFDDPQTVIAILDPDRILKDVNQTALDRVQREKGDVLEEPFWTEPWWDAAREATVKEWVDRAATGEYMEFEAQHVTPDGSEWWVSATIRPVKNDEGEVVSLIASGKDITTRKQLEQGSGK